MSDTDRRLAWRCRRGMLELDLLLQGFLADGYRELDPVGRAHFEALLALPDQELLGLLLGQATPPTQGWSDVIERIRHAAQARAAALQDS